MKDGRRRTAVRGRVVYTQRPRGGPERGLGTHLDVDGGGTASYQLKRPFEYLRRDPSGAFYHPWWAIEDLNQLHSGVAFLNARPTAPARPSRSPPRLPPAENPQPRAPAAAGGHQGRHSVCAGMIAMSGSGSDAWRAEHASDAVILETEDELRRTRRTQGGSMCCAGGHSLQSTESAKLSLG